MSKSMVFPPESYGWVTDAIRVMLHQFVGRNAGKKRRTILRVAYAQAQQQALQPLFKGDPKICSESIWHTKWKHDPAIAATFDVCYRRVLDWIDDETAAVEEHHRQQRRQRLAIYSAQAPAALAAVMADRGQKGSDRITAASALIKFADPEVAGRVRTAGGLDVNVELADLDAAIERELARLGAGPPAQVGDAEAGEIAPACVDDATSK